MNADALFIIQRMNCYKSIRQGSAVADVIGRAGHWTRDCYKVI